MLQFVLFYDYALVNGGWSSWSDWTQCSATCGTGLQARDRVCNRPAPHYGQQCNGSAREVQWCNNYTCPGSQIYRVGQLK